MRTITTTVRLAGFMRSVAAIEPLTKWVRFCRHAGSSLPRVSSVYYSTTPTSPKDAFAASWTPLKRARKYISKMMSFAMPGD